MLYTTFWLQMTIRGSNLVEFQNAVVIFTVCFLKDHVAQDNWGEERLKHLHG